MEQFHCFDCDYITNRRGKLDRHINSFKHKIRVHGITCCELTYYDKHQYSNHKRSEKHRSTKDKISPQLGDTNKIRLNIKPKLIIYPNKEKNLQGNGKIKISHCV